MTSLVVYSSQKGNTRKLAEAIYKELAGEKEIYPVEHAPAPSGYDMVYVGFWLKAGKPDPNSSEYLEKFGGGAPLFLFGTHGAAAGSDHVKNAVEHARKIAKDASVKGVFTCPGEVDPAVLEKVKQRSEPPEWIKDTPQAEGHPDEEDLAALRKRIADLQSK